MNNNELNVIGNDTGYIKIPVKNKNTFIIQKGNSYSGQTVTFPTAFSNTSWALAVCQSNAANDIGQFYTKDRTTTNFYMYKYSSQCNYHWIDIVY